MNDGCKKCSGPTCNAKIRWEITASGKRTPVNEDGSPHWATCPDRALFARRKPKENPESNIGQNH